ncbi:MAG TPA: methyl-accepting chemotaxis protein [Spirochaetia bacterium]|nr:methyl-accepting chemotaxis protein [Spirochaetia bacterium]
MKLIVKLLGAFILVSLIIAVIGLAGLLGADTLTARILDIGTRQMPRSNALLTIREAIISVEDAENMLLIKGATAEIKKDAYDTFTDAKKRMDDALKMYTVYALKGDESALWKQFLLAMTAWNTDHEQFVRLSQYNDSNPSDDIYNQMYDQAEKYSQVSIDPVLKLLEQDNDLQVKGAADAVALAKAAAARIRIISYACLVIGPIMALILGVLIALSITRPLARGVAFAKRVASGDLTTRLGDGQRGELGELAAALNAMSAQLSQIVATIQSSADQVATSSKEISATALSVAEGAQGQATTLEETSASVEELSSSVEVVSGHASSQASAADKGTSTMQMVEKSILTASNNLGEISGLASSSVESSQDGARAVGRVVEAMSLISESSSKIGGIVSVISDIADQTNLLALNASIEAARAGEHGRGFAVVAQEVSKLAERSSSATKEIEGLIKESVKKVGQGVEIASESQAAMERIKISSQKVQEMIGDLSRAMDEQVAAIKALAAALANVSEMSMSISAATEQQTLNAKQVSAAVENVNELAQSAASSAKELSASTEGLAGMAQSLQEVVGHFKINPAEAGATSATSLVPSGGALPGEAQVRVAS